LKNGVLCTGDLSDLLEMIMAGSKLINYFIEGCSGIRIGGHKGLSALLKK
jgi:hypothetical protein